MNKEKFRKQVQKELEKFNKEQVVNFAWRCAVRALPFLGSNGNFNFWNKEYRQRYIYSIFCALDINASHAASSTVSHSTADTLSRDASNALSYAASEAFSYAVYAAYDAADAAVNAVSYYSSYGASHGAVHPTVTSYAAYAASYACQAAAKNNMNLESIILRDLYNIQSRRGENQYRLTDLYGEIWGNFQKALDAEGCTYWEQLYKNFFDSGFVLDSKALSRRLNVPKEIQEQGAAAVANYLEKLEKGATRLNEARILILGDKGAGKTSIARRLNDPEAPMDTDDASTAGVNIMLWKLEHENINVRIWDFAGHIVTHAVHQFFLSERCLYIIVYDGRTEDRNRLVYWLNHMKNYGGDSKAIILVNKRDQYSVDIPINFLKEQYAIEGFYTFSIKDDKLYLEAFREKVRLYIESNPSWSRQVIPTNYFYVKNELESFFDKGDKEKGSEHITRDTFNKIAIKYGVKDIEELLEDLHFLGVSLWYKDMGEFNTLILNPEWISHGVYKIINWVNEEKKHSLNLNDFTTVFKEDEMRYPSKKHKFLFKLMMHYELAYETMDGKEIIIPHLLKEDRPKELPDFPVGESLMLRYKAEQPLPSNTVSRFIVRHNQQIKKANMNDLVWRYGVVLEDDSDCIALVREEDRSISVSVKGKDKTNYISVLRTTLNDIFNSYKSEKPELLYRIERFGQIPDELEAKDPLWLPDRKIINHHQREKPYYDDTTDQNISMAGVVYNYNIKAENIISRWQGHNIMKTTFNFRECNIGLQGNLNVLAQLLTEKDEKEEAKELENAASALEQIENCKSEEVKKKGIANRLKRLLDDLDNKESRLHKTVKGIRNGISIAQDIAKDYNNIAQWAGLPQVPTPFLK